MVLVSLAVMSHDRSLGIIGMVLAVIALVGTVLSTAGQFTHGLYLGMGVGGMERISDYPTNLWLLLLGFIAVASPAAVEGRDQTVVDLTDSAAGSGPGRRRHPEATASRPASMTAPD